MTGLPPLPKGEKVFAKLKYSEGGVIDGKAWDNSGKEIEIKGVTANG